MYLLQILSIPLLTVFLAGLRIIPESARWRTSLVAAALLQSAFIGALFEGLSALKMLTPDNVTIGWVIFFVLLLGGCALHFYQGRLNFGDVGESIKRMIPPDTASRVLLVFLLIVTVFVLLSNLLYPPQIFDALTYHLPRVRQWIQNETLDFWAVDNLRQLHHAHLNELRMASLLMLSGGSNDFLVKYPQWESFCILMVGISLILKVLGARLRSQLLGALIAGTLPMLIIQGMSAKNDVTVAALLACAYAFLLWDLREPRRLYAIMGCMAVALCLMTKSTAYLQVLPLLVVYGIFWIRRSLPQTVVRGLLGLLFFLLFAGPHIHRVYSFYGEMPAPKMEEVQSPASRFPLEEFSPRLVSLNLVRWVALISVSQQELPMRVVWKGISATHAWAGMEVDDPRITWNNTEFDLSFSRTPDRVGMGWHALLIAGGLALCVVNGCTGKMRRMPDWGLRAGFLVAAVMGLLCFISIIKWQIWGLRLIMPSLAIFCVVPALALDIADFRKGWLTLGLGIFLMAISSGYLLMAPGFALLGENSLLDRSFDERRQHAADLSALKSRLDQAAFTEKALDDGAVLEVGFRLNFDDLEYPLWLGLDHLGSPYKVHHIGIKGLGGVLEERSIRPDVIFSSKDQELGIDYGDRHYILAAEILDGVNPVNLYLWEELP